MNEREFPMIIDVEMGMPMELGKIRPDEFGDGEYWMGNRSRAFLYLPLTAPWTPMELDMIESDLI